MVRTMVGSAAEPTPMWERPAVATGLVEVVVGNCTHALTVVLESCPTSDATRHHSRAETVPVGSEMIGLGSCLGQPAEAAVRGVTERV